MNFKHWLFVFLAAAFLSTGCGGAESGDKPENSEEVEEEEEGFDESANVALSTWEGHSVSDAVGGKWVASLTFGEKVELLGESDTDAASQKSFEKVRLLDGKEGWVRADMIHKGGELMVTTSDLQVYSRPGISNIKDEVVAAGSLMIKVGENEEFIEFMGRNSGKSRQKGWLLGAKGISTDATDVSIGIMLHKALDEKVPEKRSAKLQAIVDNPANQDSPMLSVVNDKLGQLGSATTDLRDDQLMIMGDDVNVRSTPAVGENKLFKLNSGQVCDILEKGNQETVGGKTDHWYRISSGGKTGWVFGTFTSRAL